MRALIRIGLALWLVMWQAMALAQDGGATRRIVLTEKEEAWLRSHPVVTFAVDYTNPPLNFLGPDQQYRGLVIDYTELLARIAGIKPRYVGGTWNESLRRAMAHEVDAIMGARYREERRVALDFTKPYMQIPIGMATHKGFKPVRTLADFAGSRVAVIKGTVRVPLVKAKCPSCQVLEVDSPLAGVKLVADGGADAFFDDVPVVQNAIEIGLFTDFKIALYFFNEAGDVRYGVNNQMPELLSILDKALLAVRPEEREAINKRWLRLSDTAPVQRELALEPAEQQWLAEHPVIRVVAGSNRAPVEFIGPDSKELQGMTVDYLRQFEQMLNVRFDVTAADNEPARLQALAEGKVDMVSAVAARSSSDTILFTRPYVLSPIVLFARLDTPYLSDLSALAGRPVSVLRGSVISEQLAAHWPQVRQETVLSPAEGVRRVREGRADAYVGSLLTTGSVLLDNSATDIRVAGETPFEYAATFGVRKDWAPLVGILNKAMAAMPAAERDAIKQKWIGVKYSTGKDYTGVLKWLGLALAVGLLFIVQLQIMVKRRTRELRDSERRYRSLVEHAPEAIVVCDADSDAVVDLNSNAEQLFGRSRQQLLGSDLKAVFAALQPDGLPPLDTFQRARQDAMQGGSLALERTVQRPDGSEVPCEVLLVRLAEQPRGLLRASFFDITQRKRSEAELFKYQTQLEELVSARTTQLEEALQRAEAANQAKGVFLSNMSHEIRTPMNAILGYTQLMRRVPDLPPLLRKQIEVIDRSGEHLMGLINDVLEMSKIEAGRVLLQQEVLHFPALLGDVEAMLRARAQEKGLQFKVVVGSGLDESLLGDPTKLRQILVNLIGNAIKFTEQGAVTVKAMVRSRSSGALDVRIEIADTGPGIAAQDRDLVFAAFEQSGAGRRKGGTGLGLTISRQYARMMGGDIVIDSAPGPGTRLLFDCSLPLATEGALPAAPAAGRLLGRVTGLAPGSLCPNILVVDDVESNRDVVRLMLQNIGIDTVREADSGKQALEVVRSWRPDLVLMDRRMPEMDGYQACAAIAHALHGQSVKFVMLTASAFSEEREAALPTVDGYLTKPLREQALFDELQRLLPALRYVYEEPAPVAPAIGTEDQAALQRELEQLPAALAQQLAELAIICDARGFEQLCALEVLPRSPVLHRRLCELSEAFAFRHLYELLRPYGQRVP